MSCDPPILPAVSPRILSGLRHSLVLLLIILRRLLLVDLRGLLVLGSRLLVVLRLLLVVLRLLLVVLRLLLVVLRLLLVLHHLSALIVPSPELLALLREIMNGCLRLRLVRSLAVAHLAETLRLPGRRSSSLLLSRVSATGPVGIELVPWISRPPGPEIADSRVVDGIPGVRAAEEIVEERMARSDRGQHECQRHHAY